MFVRSRWILGVAALTAAAGVAHAQFTRTVPVYVNGGQLENQAVLFPQAGRTVLPMRTLFEALGARVEWDPAQRAVYAWRPDGTGIRLGLGQPVAHTLDMAPSPGPGNWGRITGTHDLDAPAMLMAGRVYVPVRFAAEALQADVRYLAREPAVYIRAENVAGYREGFPQPQPAPAPAPQPEPPQEPDRERLRQLAAALDVRLELPGQRFDRSRVAEIPMRLVVRNRSDRTITIPFRSGQHYDFQVLDQGRVVWNWASGRAFTQALTQMTLKPGEHVIFAVNWDLETNGGRRIRPGRYTVRGVLTTEFAETQIADEETITIER